MKKNIIVITGGAGFVGSNLIKLLLKKTNFKIISIDNYSSGKKKNHIKSKKIIYLKGETKDINKFLIQKKNKINAIFHSIYFSGLFYFSVFFYCVKLLNLPF